MNEKYKHEKDRVQEKHCAEIEDTRLLFNCIHYHMSPKCFAGFYGLKGLELGED